MADGICDYDPDNPHSRNWILTRISPTVTIELCDDHATPGLILLAGGELGLDPGAFYAYVEKYVKREAAKAEKALAQAQAAEQTVGSDLEPQHVDDMNVDQAEQPGEDLEETGLFHGAGEEAL